MTRERDPNNLPIVNPNDHLPDFTMKQTSRWSAFTDDELNAIQHGVRDLRDGGYDPPLTDDLAYEIHVEFAARAGIAPMTRRPLSDTPEGYR